VSCPGQREGEPGIAGVQRPQLVETAKAQQVAGEHMSLAEVDSEQSTVGVATTALVDIVGVVVVVAAAAAVGVHSQENTLASTCSGHQEVKPHTEAVVVILKQVVPKTEAESTDYNY
jgi:hypothetical protein